MKNMTRRFLTLVTTSLTILWSVCATAAYWGNDSAHFHLESPTSVMVQKTFAADCLTWQEDYPEAVRLRDEWRDKYESAERQVKGLLQDRLSYSEALESETQTRLALAASLEYWQTRAETRYSTLEVIGVGAIVLITGAAAGAGACFIWCP